jgi:hypothetical protein
MKVNLLSFNARGFNDQATIDEFKLYLQDFRPHPEILLV